MGEAGSLSRFLDAQAPVFDAVCTELRQGKKTSHWMWFIFPQLRGLGRSETARFYGIADRAEAQAYARHPVLGDRLATSTALVLAHPTRDIADMLGPVDAQKLLSCATLFEIAAPDPTLFTDVRQTFYDGAICKLTLAELEKQHG